MKKKTIAKIKEPVVRGDHLLGYVVRITKLHGKELIQEWEKSRKYTEEILKKIPKGMFYD